MGNTYNSIEETIARRNYQDTVFRKLFSEPENAIELFNALELVVKIIKMQYNDSRILRRCRKVGIIESHAPFYS